MQLHAQLARARSRPWRPAAVRRLPAAARRRRTAGPARPPAGSGGTRRAACGWRARGSGRPARRPVGPPPTRAKVSQRRRSSSSVGRLGHLEGADDLAADRERVGDRLHAGRPLGVLVVPEVGLPHAGGDDEVVVRQLDPTAARPGGDQPLRRDVDVLDLGEQALDVPVLLQQVAQRRRDLALGQDAGRALVEQRLEQVVRGPVDQGHVDRGLAQRPRREQPGETAADDHDPWPRPVGRTRLRSASISRPGRARCRRPAAAGRPPSAPSCPARSG